jgi:tRNA1(Val) A37 N6-methylase TrmN6
MGDLLPAETPLSPQDDGVQETELLGGRVRFVQPLQGYRAAIDPVLLAAAVPDGDWKSALDVGTGTGAAMLCLLSRCPQKRVAGLELLDAHADLARRSLRLNQMEGRGAVVTADVRWRPTLPPNSFDQVLSNPPFHGPGNAPAHQNRAIAHMEAVPIDVWLGFCLRMLRPRGGLTVIHRADRVDELLVGLHKKAGAVEVIPLWPRAGIAAKRVIVRARKGLKSPAVMHPGLVLHQADGRFTPQAEAILRGALSLDQAMAV